MRGSRIWLGQVESPPRLVIVENVTTWPLQHWTGTAQEFHSLDLPSERAVWRCSINSPAIILGSTQDENHIDPVVAERLKIDVARRRSGGGAVYVHPDESVWIDVVIPRDDPLWKDDISESMMWLGDVFVQAFAPFVSAHVFRNAFDIGESGRAVCFASSSPGEVFVGDAKLVGISQRRGRYGARLQCVFYRTWNPVQWADVFTSQQVRQALMQMKVAVINEPPENIIFNVLAALPQ